MTDLGATVARAVERARAGDLGAFDDLYRALSGPLLAFLRTQTRGLHDAEDLLGQVFLEAMHGMARFEGDAAGFRSWLFRIGRDRAVDLARRRARRIEEPIDAAPDAAAADDPEADVLARLERVRLWDAVGRLPAAQREVIALRLGSGLSSSEIAEVVGKDLNAVKALQHRALAGLARLLGAAGQTTPVPEESDASAENGVPGEPPATLPQ